MNKTIISEGKTSTEAIEKGLKELNATKEMVDIKILEETEKRSFYSILSPRIVKVELTLKEEKTVENNKKKNVNENIEEIKIAESDIVDFLDKFLSENINRKIDIIENEIFVDITGDNLNYLIGYRGEVINAFQKILTSIANKKSSAKIRVYVNIEGYREKRQKTLEELAEKIARTVIRTRREISLEPMTAYERKIIHTKLQNHPKVKTFSKGEEPHRKVVITLK